MRNIVSLLGLFAAFWTIPALACDADSDCVIGERTYRIRMPAGAVSEPVGAIIFNHGYRGTAAGVMRNERMGEAIARLGVALVAPQGAGGDWDIPNSPGGGSDGELAYFDTLKQALVERHGIDPDRIMVTGFSAGGMMTWELACKRGDQFAAFAPISGTFWAPVPRACPTLPAPIIHMHGTSDRVVPLKGRRIQNTKQGDVYKALKLAAPKRTHGDWGSMGEAAGLTCQHKSPDGVPPIQFCVHPGGHTMRSSWIVRAWREFETAGFL